MKILYITIIGFLLTHSVHTQTYYNEYAYTQEESIESILRVDVQNDTTTLLSIIKQNGLTVYYNYYIDAHGNALDVILRDTSSISNPLVIDTSNNYITVVPQFGILEGKLSINRVSLDGEIFLEKTIPLFDDGIQSYDIYSVAQTEENIVIAGGIRDTEGRKGFICWLDYNLNLDTLHITNLAFQSIGEIDSDGSGNVYGISAFVDYEMMNCGSCVNTARYYFTAFDKENFMDTIQLILDGEAYTNRKILTFTFTEDEDFLISYPSYNYRNPTILRYNKSIGNIWRLDSLNILHGSVKYEHHFITKNGNIIHFLSTNVGDDISNKRSGILVSLISQEGQVIWSKKFFRYEESGLNKYDIYARLVETSEHFLFYGIHVLSLIDQKPLLIKIDKNGCLTEDCHIAQVEGYYPKPNMMVSHRNIWYIHNTKTDKQYRYTFIDQRIPHLRGTLMRSDAMSGDDWYSTGRQFISGFTEMNEDNYPDVPGFNSILYYYYNYDFDIGDELVLWHTAEPPHSHHILKVIDRDTIAFLDGRPRAKITLECYNHTIDIEPQQVTWIDYLGDPNDVFNTLNACGEHGSEVVTCFYSAGELMWSHPDYTTCAPTGANELEMDEFVNPLYPNPTDGILYLPDDLEDFVIYSADGQEVMRATARGSQSYIDVSHLYNGLYFLLNKDFGYGNRVYRFVKM